MTQAYNLSQLANNLNSSGQLDATDGLVNAVPVANGGTGASSSAAARTNLGAAKGTMSAFSFVESGTNLLVQYNGTTVFAISSSGAILTAGNVSISGDVTATGNVTAYGSV